ncbi:hypothetical protein [Cystobacter fuscus]|uniref:hypothetical protein n=1 Tax=Cystobacter fuscus TaxID=43 RepID=UPI002B31CD65|nr:hypothetical protein F0U63_10120 [Cystobacter fuscus]
MRGIAAVCLLLMAVLVAPGAHAAGEAGQVRAVMEAGLSQDTALGQRWAPRTSYNVSLWGLSEAGQGVGARLSVLPPATSSGGPWELSTDTVVPVSACTPAFKNEGMLQDGLSRA